MICATQAEIESKVLRIVGEVLSSVEKDITLSSNFIDDLGADSLDTVEMVMAFEQEFDIEIPDEIAENIKTVQNAVDYIKEQETN